MKCPRCKGKTMVRQKYNRDRYVKRERICTQCGLHYYTWELREEDLKDAGIEVFG